MAQTSTGKKLVFVRGHTRNDGVRVPNHYRTPPSKSRSARTRAPSYKFKFAHKR